MSEPTYMAAMYNAAPIILWVEDLVTAAYLGALWRHDRRFQFYIGGGHESLKALVEDARAAGRRGVYGLRDRDFGPTNRPRWHAPGLVNFALETFEIECFVLDPVTLAECTLNTARRSEAEIHERLTRQAHEHLWWMACRQVLAELRDRRQVGFPRHPKRAEVPTRAAAEALLCSNEWAQTTAPGLIKFVEAERLKQRLTDAHQHYSQHLAAGTWASVYSGKELLAELVTWLYTRNRPTGSAARDDLVKAVAHEQVKAGREPPELLELRDALVTHSARVPAAP